MAIALLIIFSALAITGYYFLANKLGFTKNLQWTSIHAAEKFFLQDYELDAIGKSQIQTACLCNDKQVALFKLEPQANTYSKIGLVYSHGNRWVTYVVTSENLESMHNDSKHLILNFNDYTLPELKLDFSDPDTCQEWHTYLNYLVKNQTAKRSIEFIT